MAEEPPRRAQRPAILLVDHGSRAPTANQRLGELARLLEQALRSRGENLPVAFAHMELAAPSIATAVEACARDGVDHLVVVPCMLSRGRHVAEDIPRLVEEAVHPHVGLTFRVDPPLSEQAGFIDWLGESILFRMR